MQEPACTVSYLLLLEDLVKRRGVGQERWLAHAGVAPDVLADPAAFVSLSDTKKLVTSAMHCSGDLALGLYFGELLNLSAHGLLGYAGMISPDVGGALEIGFAYVATRSPLLGLELERGEGAAAISINIKADLGYDLEVFAVCALFTTFGAIAKHLLAPGLPHVRIQTALQRPPFHELLPVFYPALDGVDYDGVGHHIVMDASELDRPLPLANEVTHRMIRQRVDEQLVSIQSSLSPSWKASVEELLRSSPGHIMSVGDVGERLGVGVRTLHRRLVAEDTTFSALVDEVRFALAREYLLTTDLSVTDVAHLLHYTDSSNFARAFKRWAGLSPLAYRISSVTRVTSVLS